LLLGATKADTVVNAVINREQTEELCILSSPARPVRYTSKMEKLAFDETSFVGLLGKLIGEVR
jgi:hypothetical protein